LLRAAAQGDVRKAENSLAREADINAADENGRTSVYYASAKGHTSILKLLLLARANVNAKANNGWTPLIAAAYLGQAEAAEMLLAAGARVDDRIVYTKRIVTPAEGILPNDTTALMMAAQAGHLTTVEVLLRHGGSVRAVDDQGWSALTHAAKHGHEDIVRSLIHAGADLKTPDKAGFSPLIVAARNGQGAVVRALLSAGCEVDWRDKGEGGTALIHTIAIALYDARWNAVREGRKFTGPLVDEARADVIAALLAGRADPNAVVPRVGQSPLMKAAQAGYNAAVELLLAKGADVNLRDADGATALTYAADKSLEVVNTLPRKQADPNIADKEGTTPLMLASNLGTAASVKALITGGANVNAKAKSGWTALMYAAVTGDVQIVRELLAAGADPGFKNEEGQTAAMVAEKEKNPAVAAAIQRFISQH